MRDVDREEEAVTLETSEPSSANFCTEAPQLLHRSDPTLPALTLSMPADGLLVIGHEIVENRGTLSENSF